MLPVPTRWSFLCKKFKDEFDVDWGVSYIDKVFNNHFYYGVMVIKDKMYPHRYPPIITQSLFEQVQQVKHGFNKKNRYKYAGRPYIYRGLLRCAHCGLAITPEKHKGHVYYLCTQYNGKHGAKWLREEEITEQVGRVFKQMQIPQEILESITETLKEVHEGKVEFHNKILKELTKEQKTTTEMIDNLYMDKLKGSITESQYDKFYKALRDKLTQITIKLDQLQEADDNYFITTKYVLDVTNRAYDLFLSSEVEEKRQLIKLVLSNLRIEDENVFYDVQKPFDLIVNCSEGLLWRP